MLELQTIFIAMSIAHGIPEGLLSSLCKVESGHKPAALNAKDGNSPSYGLCQIKLATAQSVGFKGRPKDLMHPATNAWYAAVYLKKQHNRYRSWVRAVKAYNAGRAMNADHNQYSKKVYTLWGAL